MQVGVGVAFQPRRAHLPASGGFARPPKADESLAGSVLKPNRGLLNTFIY